MDEKYGVIVLSAIVPMLFFQSLGFFSPFWGCFNEDKNNQTKPCGIKGLYYTCDDGGCYSDVPIPELFGFFLASFLLTLVTSVYKFITTYFALSSEGSCKFEWDKITILFTFSQLWTAFWHVACLQGFEVVGWSCMVFGSCSYPFAIAFFFSIWVCCKDYICRKCRTQQ